MARPEMMEYRDKLALMESYKRESDPARKNELKLTIALEMVKEINRCFNNYNDQGERSRLDMLIDFLSGDKDEVTFYDHFPAYRYKGDWSS